MVMWVMANYNIKSLQLACNSW